jgi:hypothetical protein
MSFPSYITMVEAQSDEERTFTDVQLIERLQELERQSIEFHDEEGTWYYSLGCLLGELSGQLFPVTPQDYALWEDIERRFWAQVQAPGCSIYTRPVDSVPVVEYTV